MINTITINNVWTFIASVWLYLVTEKFLFPVETIKILLLTKCFDYWQREFFYIQYSETLEQISWQLPSFEHFRLKSHNNNQQRLILHSLVQDPLFFSHYVLFHGQYHCFYTPNVRQNVNYCQYTVLVTFNLFRNFPS